MKLEELQKTVSRLAFLGEQETTFRVGSINVFLEAVEKQLGYELINDRTTVGRFSFAGIKVVEDEVLPNHVVAIMKGDVLEKIVFLTNDENTK